MYPRRGSVVSAVPYKFTFALYAIGCLANVACAYRGGGEAGGGGWECALPHGAGLTSTHALIRGHSLARYGYSLATYGLAAQPRTATA